MAVLAVVLTGQSAAGEDHEKRALHERLLASMDATYVFLPISVSCGSDPSGMIEVIGQNILGQRHRIRLWTDNGKPIKLRQDTAEKNSVYELVISSDFVLSHDFSKPEPMNIMSTGLIKGLTHAASVFCPQSGSKDPVHGKRLATHRAWLLKAGRQKTLSHNNYRISTTNCLPAGRLEVTRANPAEHALTEVYVIQKERVVYYQALGADAGKPTELLLELRGDDMIWVREFLRWDQISQRGMVLSRLYCK
jgi:hypothetical protein